jgi:hypothetical protein
VYRPSELACALKALPVRQRHLAARGRGSHLAQNVPNVDLDDLLELVLGQWQQVVKGWEDELWCLFNKHCDWFYQRGSNFVCELDAMVADVTPDRAQATPLLQFDGFARILKALAPDFARPGQCSLSRARVSGLMTEACESEQTHKLGALRARYFSAVRPAADAPPPPPPPLGTSYEDGVPAQPVDRPFFIDTAGSVPRCQWEDPFADTAAGPTCEMSWLVFRDVCLGAGLQRARDEDAHNRGRAAAQLGGWAERQLAQKRSAEAVRAAAAAEARAVRDAEESAKTNALFPMGTLVQACQGASGGGKKKNHNPVWRSGRVARVLQDGRMDVDFDSGEHEAGVTREHVRARPKKKH